MKMFVFPTPLDAHAVLTHDTGGWTLTGVPDVHPTGRQGQSFTIPDATPDGNGAHLTITAPKKVPYQLRGILYLNLPTGPGLLVDDYPMTDAAVTLPRLQVNGQFLAQDV